MSYAEASAPYLCLTMVVNKMMLKSYFVEYVEDMLDHDSILEQMPHLHVWNELRNTPQAQTIFKVCTNVAFTKYRLKIKKWEKSPQHQEAFADGSSGKIYDSIMWLGLQFACEQICDNLQTVPTSTAPHHLRAAYFKTMDRNHKRFW